MFFRRKKKAQEGESSKAASSRPAPSTAPSGDDAGVDQSTQFLTGDSGTDRRTVQVLLEAIAELSQHRDTDTLLRLIVDRSIEVTGAERGLLVLLQNGELNVRNGRTKGNQPVADDVRSMINDSDREIRAQVRAIGFRLLGRLGSGAPPPPPLPNSPFLYLSNSPLLSSLKQ